MAVVPFTIFGYENFQIKHFQQDFWSGRKIEEKTLLFTQRLLESLNKNLTLPGSYMNTGQQIGHLGGSGIAC